MQTRSINTRNMRIITWIVGQLKLHSMPWLFFLYATAHNIILQLERRLSNTDNHIDNRSCLPALLHLHLLLTCWLKSRPPLIIALMPCHKSTWRRAGGGAAASAADKWSLYIALLGVQCKYNSHPLGDKSGPVAVVVVLFCRPANNNYYSIVVLFGARPHLNNINTISRSPIRPMFIYICACQLIAQR